MLHSKDNETLTKVSPGTPMGRFMRLHWIPAMLSNDLVIDGPPKRIRLLGENLIAFRNSQGEVGILAAGCPHRGAPMFFARNEESGLRCVYHGWKFSKDGRCVDMPTEPPESNHKEAVRTRAYPVEERNGVVWVYMQIDVEKVPPLPDLEWNLVPDSQRHLSLRIQECNWLQALEGEIDTAHAPILHGRIDAAGNSLLSKNTMLNKVTHPTLSVKEGDYGLAIASERAFEGTHYWRINQFLFPFYTLVPPFEGNLSGHAWVPIDDELTLCFMFSYDPTHPLDEKILDIYKNGYKGRESGHPSMNGVVRRPGQPYEDYWPKYNRDNDYGINWEEQKVKRFSGLPGLWVQDAACQGGINRIVDRSVEQLGNTDLGIVRTRNVLLKAVRRFEDEHVRPKTSDDASTYAVRAVALNLEESQSWEEALQVAGKAVGELVYSRPDLVEKV